MVVYGGKKRGGSGSFGFDDKKNQFFGFVRVRSEKDRAKKGETDGNRGRGGATYRRCRLHNGRFYVAGTCRTCIDGIKFKRYIIICARFKTKQPDAVASAAAAALLAAVGVAATASAAGGGWFCCRSAGLVLNQSTTDHESLTLGRAH